ncbi:MAG: hypothetical protein AMS22_03130 [Thiotrichales bacterium SG8_50]|nr:MAG: hypothetical protein AMS22_03130 [Thiotrichales bacterium SG8_50]
MRRNRNLGRRAILLTTALFGVSYAMALTIDALDVTSQGRTFKVKMKLEIAAPVDQIVAVLTDYRYPDRLSPKVTKKDVISRSEEITRVRIEFRSCVFLYCKNLILTQDVTANAGAIYAETIPELSDFLSGSMHWLVSPDGNGGSHIIYIAVMEPDIFIPPFIGEPLIRTRLRREMLEIAKNLESEVSHQPALKLNQ